jgi:hypothetical protein
MFQTQTQTQFQSAHFVIPVKTEKSEIELNKEQMDTIYSIFKNLNLSLFIYTPSKITYNLNFISFQSNDRVVGDKNTALDGLNDTYKFNEKLKKKALDFNNAPYKLKTEQVKTDREINKNSIFNLINENYPNIQNKKQILNNIIKCINNKMLNNPFFVIKKDEYTYNNLFVPVFEHYKSIQVIPTTAHILNIPVKKTTKYEKNTDVSIIKKNKKVLKKIKQLENVWDEEEEEEEEEEAKTIETETVETETV